MINLSFWNTRRHQNATLWTHCSYILSGTANKSKILRKILCNNMNYVSRFFRKICWHWACTALRRMEWGLKVEPRARSRIRFQTGYRWGAGGGSSWWCWIFRTFVNKFLKIVRINSDGHQTLAFLNRVQNSYWKNNLEINLKGPMCHHNFGHVLRALEFVFNSHPSSFESLKKRVLSISDKLGF